MTAALETAVVSSSKSFFFGKRKSFDLDSGLS